MNCTGTGSRALSSPFMVLTGGVRSKLRLNGRLKWL